MKFFERLSPTTKGLLAIVVGVVLALDRFNFFHHQLQNIILIGALGLIAYGLMLGGFISKLTAKLRGTADNSNVKSE